MIIKINTQKTVAATAEALQAAVAENGFGVMQVHNLGETMEKKGVGFDRECLIFEVCQPKLAKKVLEGDMSLSTALPCRISIYEEDGQTFMATLKPTALMGMWELPDLSGVAQEVEETLLKIMKTAAA